MQDSGNAQVRRMVRANGVDAHVLRGALVPLVSRVIALSAVIVVLAWCAEAMR